MEVSTAICLILFLDFQPYIMNIYSKTTPKDKEDLDYFRESEELQLFFNKSIQKCKKILDLHEYNWVYYLYFELKNTQSMERRIKQTLEPINIL